MSITYLDFEHINNKDTDEICKADLNLSTTIPYNNYNKLSISKVDIDVDNFYFMRVLLDKQPEDDDTVFEKYTGLRDKDGNVFSNKYGWFLTKYKFVIKCKTSSSSQSITKECPVLFKSNEIQFNIDKIPFNKNESDNTRTYDNFNEYFCSYSPNNFLSSLNECIRVQLKNALNLTDNQVINLLPKFHTNDKQLLVDNFTYGVGQELQNQDLIKQFQFPEEVENYSGNTKCFCFGLNKDLNNLLYHSLTTKKYYKSSTYPEDYYFLELNQILNTSLSIPKNNSSTEYFNITTQYVNEFYDMGDIKVILIKSNLPVAPLYQNVKKPNYILDSNENDTYDINDGVIFKMSINNNTLAPTRFIFSQPSITNNFSSLAGLNMTHYDITVFYYDKYGFSYPLTLTKGSKMYLQLACFS